MSGIVAEREVVLYEAPVLPLYSTMHQPLRSVPAGPAISIASPTSVPVLS